MMQKRTLAAVVAVVLVVAGVIAVAQVSVYTPGPPVAANPAAAQSARFSAGTVRSDIATAGYTDIHDMKFRHGEWSADAETRRGKTVSLLVDPANGKVLATRQG